MKKIKNTFNPFCPPETEEETKKRQEEFITMTNSLFNLSEKQSNDWVERTSSFMRNKQENKT